MASDFFVWTRHYTVFDGWSTPLILKQVGEVYWGKKADTLPPFQGFFKHIMQSNNDAGQYWQDQLQGSEAVLFPALPSARYQPQADHTVQHQISALQWPHNGITASAVVRAAWTFLLSGSTLHTFIRCGVWCNSDRPKCLTPWN